MSNVLRLDPTREQAVSISAHVSGLVHSGVVWNGGGDQETLRSAMCLITDPLKCNRRVQGISTPSWRQSGRGVEVGTLFFKAGVLKQVGITKNFNVVDRNLLVPLVGLI